MLRDIHFCYLHLRVISLGSRASKKYAAETRALDFGRHCCIAGKGQWDIQFVFSARDNTGIACLRAPFRSYSATLNCGPSRFNCLTLPMI